MKTLREEMITPEYVVEKETKVICWVHKSIYEGKLYRSLRPVKIGDDIGNGCGMDLHLKDDRTVLDERFLPLEVI